MSSPFYAVPAEREPPPAPCDADEGIDIVHSVSATEGIGRADATDRHLVDAWLAPVGRDRGMDRRGRGACRRPDTPERHQQRCIQVPPSIGREQAGRRPATGFVPQRQRHPHHRGLQLHSPSDGDGQGGHRRGRDLVEERRPTHQRRADRVLQGRQRRPAVRQPERQPGRGTVPRLRGCHPGALRRQRRGHAGAGDRARRPDHRRLQDLPERRHQAARGDGVPGSRAAPADLPLSRPPLRAVDHRRVRLLRRRRHHRPHRHGGRRHRIRAGHLADGDPPVRGRDRLRAPPDLPVSRGTAKRAGYPRSFGDRPRRDLGSDRGERADRHPGRRDPGLRHLRRLHLVRPRPGGRRLRHPDRRPHPDAGHAGRPRPARLLASSAAIG